MKMKAD